MRRDQVSTAWNPSSLRDAHSWAPATLRLSRSHERNSEVTPDCTCFNKHCKQDMSILSDL